MSTLLFSPELFQWVRIGGMFCYIDYSPSATNFFRCSIMFRLSVLLSCAISSLALRTSPLKGLRSWSALDGSVVPRSERDMKVSNALRAIAFFGPLTASALVAKAGFFESTEQSELNRLSKFQAPIAELLDSLRVSDTPNAVGVYSKTQILKGGKEDSDVVLNYLEAYIKPCQMKMAALAPKLQLEGESQTRIELLPSLMKGHILELREAIRSQKAEAQAREVQEVQETLAEFLLLASKKYEVTPYIPIRPLTDKELYGPFGCEFWGKKRVPGSNACASNE